MSEIDRFRPEDRRGIDLLYRRTHGADAAEANRLRWDWQHRRNPSNRTGHPGIWVAREGPTIVGHYPTVPIRISLKGLEVDGAWGTDALVAPERDRQGLDEALLRAWDRNSGAVLALGVSAESRARARPAALAGYSRRAVPGEAAHATGAAVTSAAHAVQQVDFRAPASRWCRWWRAPRPLGAECEPIRRFDTSFTASVGAACAEIRFGRASRLAVSQLAVCRAAARPLLDRGAEAAGRSFMATPCTAIVTSRSAV